MKNLEFIQLYKTNPCRFHASAIWKTLVKKDIKMDVLTDENGAKRIKIYNEISMFLYWDRDSSELCDIKEYQWALLHHSQVKKWSTYNDKYFRLIYDNNDPIKHETNCVIKNVDIKNEAQMVSEFICKCYKDINQSEENVLSWVNYPVFDSNLWIWVMDTDTGEYIGLGIAEYDKDIKEGSLEWIQVLPEHNGKGVGKAIVFELLKRMKHADFITVSGRVDNTAAEKLYRNCGFKGNDIWYIIRSKTKQK